MRRLIRAIFLTGMLSLGSTAGILTEINDSELDSVYAQGFNFTIGSDSFRSFNIGGNLYNVNVGDINVNDGGLQFNMESSLMLSGNAQQNAFMGIQLKS